MKKYNEKELNDYLKKELNFWENNQLKFIEATFKFKNFKESIKFINEIAEYAENIDHHPDIKINYDKVNLQLSTHTENAITNLDTELALKIQDLYKKDYKTTK